MHRLVCQEYRCTVYTIYTVVRFGGFQEPINQDGVVRLGDFAEFLPSWVGAHGFDQWLAWSKMENC